MNSIHYFDPEDSQWEGLQLQAASLRRWLVTQLRAAIKFLDSTSGEVRDATIDGLCGKAPELLTWHADERYRGDEWANGGWSLNHDAVKRLLPAAIEAARREVDRARFPTLDDFLIALDAGELGAPGPREPAAVSLVADPEAFRAALKARRIPCRCGVRFVRKSSNERTCPNCRARQRELRTTHATQEQAALQAGAKHLRTFLRKRGVDPFAFPKKTYLWLTDDAMREWLTGVSAPRAGLAVVAEKFWGLSKHEARLIRWAFRRPGLWPADLREELVARFRSYRIPRGGEHGK